ncbi:MAG: hypothetical protein AAF191_06485, partial [Verrucomicrobiota bacterium]
MNLRSLGNGSFLLLLALSLGGCGKLADKLKAPEAEDSAMERSVQEIDLEPVYAEVIPPPPEPEESGPLINQEAQVSILGYHDFSSSRRVTDMVMHPDKFREQMETIRASEIP